MIEQKEYYDRKKAEEMAPAKELYDAMSTVIKKQYPEQWKELFLQWIPVNKELPKKDGEYLVTVGGEATFPDVDTAWFCYGHWMHQFGCAVYKMDFNPEARELSRTPKVIAWMPLPKPYREESEDKT